MDNRIKLKQLRIGTTKLRHGGSTERDNWKTPNEYGAADERHSFFIYKNMDTIRIETRTIKKVLYRIDPEAPKDEEFIEHINMLLLLMEQEQKKRDCRNGRT